MSFDAPAARPARRAQLALKRLADVVLCLIISILALPFMAAIALSVRLSSPGPIFFVQERVGLRLRTFKMIKFRTMAVRPALEQATAWTAAEEARITPVGRLLRDYGLDELPQILSILKGDMSIVGPRPPLPAQVKDYTERQHRMFEMRPGVLSLAAIMGRRSLTTEQRIELHVRYVQEWSLRLDLLILWRALFVVLGRQDASETITH
jgi:lipopolysaccharide/colanic/teichoic acid biosynthesis glycosyltransferase